MWSSILKYNLTSWPYIYIFINIIFEYTWINYTLQNLYLIGRGFSFVVNPFLYQFATKFILKNGLSTQVYY